MVNVLYGVSWLIPPKKVTGGPNSPSEYYTLNWVERDSDDHIFGCMTEKIRRIPVDEITDKFLKKDCTRDTINNNLILVNSWNTPGKNKYKWRAAQVTTRNIVHA
ncbi:hypothetical protein JVU11DRAFT_228 [Chiua virens]|nr:hypothetical protein JVU11DRAFT_228 [Chiua virens]